MGAAASYDKAASASPRPVGGGFHCAQRVNKSPILSRKITGPISGALAMSPRVNGRRAIYSNSEVTFTTSSPLKP